MVSGEFCSEAVRNFLARSCERTAALAKGYQNGQPVTDLVIQGDDSEVSTIRSFQAA